MKISLENGKYEVVFNEKNGSLSVYHHGEFCSDETGNKLLLAMIDHIEDLEIEISDYQSEIREYYDYDR